MDRLVRNGTASRHHRRSIVGILIIWFVLGIFVHLRVGDAPGLGHWDRRWWNDEVELHFLNTLAEFQGKPLAQHWFAPIPCTSPPNMPCMGTPTPSTVLPSSVLKNKLIYISFPPGATAISSLFVFPISNIFNISALNSLRIWNLLLDLFTPLLFYFTLYRLLSPRPHNQAGLAFLGSLPLLISVESLHSHHLSLWAHQVFQPFIAGILLLSLGRMTTGRALALGMLCAIGGWIEWTAYFLSIAIFFVVLCKSERKKKFLNLSVFSVAAVSGGISLLAYYSWLVGLRPYFASLSERFSARTVTVDYYDWGDWFISLFQSYGPWIGVIALMACLLFAARKWHGKQSAIPINNRADWVLLLFASGFILVENVLMFEHAIVYTFDRLKWGFFLGVLLSLIGTTMVGRFGKRGFALFCAFAMIASLLSIIQFLDLYRPYWR